MYKDQKDYCLISSALEKWCHCVILVCIAQSTACNLIYVYLSFQSAAALCIGVGSFSDPDDIPGLAHFLEHSKNSFAK